MTMNELAGAEAGQFNWPEDDPSPFPAFTLAIPPGWSVDEAPDAVVVLAEPETASRFRANVMLSVDRIASTTTLAEIGQITLERARVQTPGHALVDEKVIEVEGAPGLTRVAQISLGEVDVFQVQLFFLADTGGGRTRALFQLTGSCLLADADRYADIFGAVAHSLRLRGAHVERA